MPADENIPEFVAVVCPVCRTRMDASVAETAGTVDCPDCFTEVRVPPLAEVLAARPKKVEVADPGAYAISVEPEHPREVARRKEAEAAVTAEILCPHCRSRVTPDLYDRPRNITCPDCLEVIEVPSRKEWRKKRGTVRKRPVADPSPYDLVPEPAAVPTPSVIAPKPESKPEPVAKPYDAMAEVRREKSAKTPAWTFFTDVYSLPWRPDALRCWIQLSLGCSGLGFLVAVINWLIADGMILVMPFFALPFIWVAFWVCSYAVSSGLTILEATANGHNEITEWNDGGWSGWMVDSFAPAFLASVTWLITFYSAKLGTLAFGEELLYPVAAVLFVLLFPVVLLSSMEAGSPFIPFTWPILRTLFRSGLLWMTYFGMAVATAAAWFLPVWLGLREGWWFSTLMLTGPLLAAVVMIEARLLGRLAWKAIVFRERKRRRKKKPKADQPETTSPQRTDGQAFRRETGPMSSTL